MTGNGGQLTSLTTAPEGDVHYDGPEAEPSSIDLVVSAKLSGAVQLPREGEPERADPGAE